MLHVSDDTNVSGHIDVQLYGLIIGDCPKCGARTFVIKELSKRTLGVNATSGGTL